MSSLGCVTLLLKFKTVEFFHIYTASCLISNCKTDDFLWKWALLTAFIKASALCHNAELAIAALKSFQEILQINKDISPDDAKSYEWKMLFNPHKPGEDSVATDADPAETDELAAGAVDDMPLWSNAWRVWRIIGTAVTTAPEASVAGESRSMTETYVSAQAFLTALIQTFAALYVHIKSQFVTAELQKLCHSAAPALCSLSQLGVAVHRFANR